MDAVEGTIGGNLADGLGFRSVAAHKSWNLCQGLNTVQTSEEVIGLPKLKVKRGIGATGIDSKTCSSGVTLTVVMDRLCSLCQNG